MSGYPVLSSELRSVPHCLISDVLGRSSSFIYVAVTSPMTKSSLGGDKIYLAYSSRHNPSLREEIEGWNLKVDLPCSTEFSRNGLTAQEVQQKPGKNLLDDLQTGLYLHSFFFIQLSTTCLGNGASHCGLGPPMLINNQDDHPHRPV